MPRFIDKSSTEYDCVLVLENENSKTPLLECIYCKHRFRGSATRIRAHIIGQSGMGVRRCSGTLPDSIVEKLSQINEDAVKRNLENERNRKLKANAVLASTPDRNIKKMLQNSTQENLNVKRHDERQRQTLTHVA